MDNELQMPEELFELIILIGLSIVVAIIFLIPIIIWRLIRGKTIYHGARKLDSPIVLYVGIIFFSGFGLLAFATGKPYYGSVFLLFMVLFIIGLIAYQHGWRG